MIKVFLQPQSLFFSQYVHRPLANDACEALLMCMKLYLFGWDQQTSLFGAVTHTYMSCKIFARNLTEVGSWAVCADSRLSLERGKNPVSSSPSLQAVSPCRSGTWTGPTSSPSWRWSSPAWASWSPPLSPLCSSSTVIRPWLSPPVENSVTLSWPASSWAISVPSP